MQSNKLRELRHYSDPDYVMQKAKMMGLNPVHESSRKDKKNIWCSLQLKIRWFTLGHFHMKIIQNITMKTV